MGIHRRCPGGVSERPPTSIVVTHCECDSADADLFSVVLHISPASGYKFQKLNTTVTKYELIIKDTHRGLRYEDGVLVKVLEAGRYTIPLKRFLFFRPKPRVEVQLV